MKFIRIFLLLPTFFVVMFGENYVDIYRKSGISAVQKIFDKELQSTQYWSDYLKDQNTTYGYFEGKKYIIVTNKKNKTINIFLADGKGGLEKIFTNKIITGKDGQKKTEGDLITPIGTYSVVSKFTPKNTFYGPLALPISYPNIIDKIEGRDGHGIWIHGYPLDHEKRPPFSKGCMVLKNSALIKLGKLVDPKNTFVIIYEKSLKTDRKKDISRVISFLYSWKYAWQSNDIDRYLSFYSKNFKRYDGMGLKSFSEYKKNIFSRKEKKDIFFSKINILPYPNLKKEQIYKVKFYEIYKTRHYNFQGDKVLYVKVGKNIKIIAEK